MQEQGLLSWRGMFADTYNHAAMGQAEPSARAVFIRRTYAHLAGAIALFVVLEAFLLSLPIAKTFTAYAGNKIVWLAVLGGYILVSAIADSWARNCTSRTMQYVGLGLYVCAEAVLFVPLLTIAKLVSPEIIPIAAMLTGILAGGLTMVCFVTRRDFSFLRSLLCVGGFAGLGLIICSAVFGFGLGFWFSAAMIILACASILYSTSATLHDYNTDQHVAASLSLFAAIALLFWYIVRILIQIYLSAQE